MNPRNTNQLRRLIENRQAVHHWGRPHIVTPRLVSHVWGDGRKLLALYPMMMRPNHFVVRLDSSWSTSNWDRDAKVGPHEWLDGFRGTPGVYDVIEDEFVEWPWARMYGLRWADRGEERSSRVDWNDGCTWSEMSWPRLRRGRSTA